MRALLALVILFLVLCCNDLAAESGTSCKNGPKVVGPCFVVHGRLSAWNGTPSIRIWRVGTKRMLGVFDASGTEDGGETVPASVSKLLAGDVSATEIYGNYEVCPFERQRLGVMQPVCIDNASNLVSRHSR